MAKYFECPKCKEINSATDWFNMTKTWYGDDEQTHLVKPTDEDMEEAYFYCPYCEKESEGINMISRRKPK